MEEDDLSENAAEWLQVVRDHYTEWDKGTLEVSLEQDWCSEEEIAFILNQLKSLSSP